MIDIDKNRKTFRSNVKRRSGNRLPGLEMYYQGVDLSEVNIAHCATPIGGRGGYVYQHNYAEAHAVYETVVDPNVDGLEKIIDIFLDIDSAASYISGQTDFSLLDGQTFTIANPEYLKDPTQPQSWEFIFKSSVDGVDPRLVYQSDGLYSGFPGMNGSSFNINLKDHLLRPYPRKEEHALFEVEHATDLAKYGQLNNNQYEIPVGFGNIVNVPFPNDELPTPNPTDDPIDPANFDLSDADVYRNLASNPYWLYAVITRSLYNVLPNSYFEILEPSYVPYINIEKAPGAVFLWDKYELSNTATSPNLRIKLRYSPLVPTSQASLNNSYGGDITGDNWDFAKGRTWAKIGHKVIEQDKNKFFENKRTDYLSQTFIRPLATNGSVTSADIRFYQPSVSKGTTNPAFSTGDEISKYEEALSLVSPAAGLKVISEQIDIHKSQKQDYIANSYMQDQTYYEDIHYHDPNGQTWAQMQDKWNQWVDVNDHNNNDTEGFLQHVRNLIDYRYAPMRLIPEYPMSGRLDVFNSIRSFYENMPETVLWNTKKSTSAQSFDLDAVFISKNKYLKKSESIDVKKFEDVKGIRPEGDNQFHRIEILSSSNLTITKNGVQYIIPPGEYRGDGESWVNGVFQTSITYLGEKKTIEFGTQGTYSFGSYPAPNTTIADYRYIDIVYAVSPGNAVMFNDYFDQLEPDVLDYIEEERWTRIDSEMMIWLTKRYWDHDNDVATAEKETGRTIEIDRREWQQDDYLYTNTGHTAVHYQRVNGIVSQEHKR